jgi:hypothetical protein
MTHPYLSDLDDAALHKEIVEAGRQIEQVISKDPWRIFPVPGAATLKVARTAGYRSMANSQTSENSALRRSVLCGPSSDPAGYERIIIPVHLPGEGCGRDGFAIRCNTPPGT